MDKLLVYSPTQAAAGAFLGGPMASAYFIRKNFLTLGNKAGARESLIYGAVVVLAVLAILPFLPEKFPNMAIPLATLIVTRMIIEKYQLTKQAIVDSEQYTFHSNWRVFWIGLLSMVIFLVIGMGLIFSLDHLGVIDLS